MIDEHAGAADPLGDKIGAQTSLKKDVVPVQRNKKEERRQRDALESPGGTGASAVESPADSGSGNGKGLGKAA